MVNGLWSNLNWPGFLKGGYCACQPPIGPLWILAYPLKKQALIPLSSSFAFHTTKTHFIYLTRRQRCRFVTIILRQSEKTCNLRKNWACVCNVWGHSQSPTGIWSTAWRNTGSTFVYTLLVRSAEECSSNFCVTAVDTPFLGRGPVHSDWLVGLVQKLLIDLPTGALPWHLRSYC